MVRASDNPEAKIWGIRITGVNEVRSEILKDISGIIVVIHQKGSGATVEKPHYHIYYEHPKLIKREKLKKEWVKDKYPKLFEGLDGKRDDYSFKTDDSYSLNTYWEYVWDELKKPGRQPSLLCWNHDTLQFAIPKFDDLIIHDFGETNLLSKVVEVKQSKRKTTKMKLEAFYQKEVKEWSEEHPDEIIDKDDILDLLYDYWHAEESEGCEKLQAVQMYVDYAEYRFHQDHKTLHESAGKIVRADWKRRALKTLSPR